MKVLDLNNLPINADVYRAEMQQIISDVSHRAAMTRGQLESAAQIIIAKDNEIAALKKELDEIQLMKAS